MTNSATSTDNRRGAGGSVFHSWHFFLLLSMVAATVAVLVANETHPAALLLLSAAVVSAGLVGLAISRAIAGFFNAGTEPAPLGKRTREELEHEKLLTLRSIKELEFDRKLGKVGDADYAALLTSLRARAMVLMQELDRSAPEPVVAPPAATATHSSDRSACPSCGTANDPDARFCKACGTSMETPR